MHDFELISLLFCCGPCIVKLSLYFLFFLFCRNFCQEIAKLNLHEAVIKCNLQEELGTVIAFVKSGEMGNASNKNVIRLMVGVSIVACLDDLFHINWTI